MPDSDLLKYVLIVGAALGLAGRGPLLRAQEVERAIEPPPAAEASARLETTQVEETLFGGTAEEGRRQLDALLDVAIKNIGRIVSISEFQKAKLHVAGRGDVHRFLTLVEALKADLASPAASSGKGSSLGEVGKLRRLLNLDLFGEGSLFAKAVRSVLTADQLADYECAIEEQQRREYEAVVTSAVETLGQRLDLDESTRQRLVRLLLEEPRTRASSRNDERIVQLSLSRLPEGRVRSLFNGGQWHRLRQIQDANREYVAYLVKIGQVPQEVMGVEAAEGQASDHRKPLVELW